MQFHAGIHLTSSPSRPYAAAKSTSSCHVIRSLHISKSGRTCYYKVHPAQRSGKAQQQDLHWAAGTAVAYLLADKVAWAAEGSAAQFTDRPGSFGSYVSGLLPLSVVQILANPTSMHWCSAGPHRGCVLLPRSYNAVHSYARGGALSFTFA